MHFARSKTLFSIERRADETGNPIPFRSFELVCTTLFAVRINAAVEEVAQC